MTDPTPNVAPAPPRRRLRKRVWLAGLILVALVVLGFAIRIAWIGGVFTRIAPHFAGRCRLVEGPVGAEDMTIDVRIRRAYISAADRRAEMAGAPKPGAIWAYDLDGVGQMPVNLTPDAGLYFQPHGISLWRAADGHDVLFVVNHPAAGHGWPPHTIEIYDVGAEQLTHRATLTDERLVMPNDVVAVGRDRFYVTNTHQYPPGWRQTLESYLQLRGAQVLRYGPGGFTTAIANLVFPNGINVSADGRTLYIASTTWQNVLVYDRDPASDALTPRREIPIGSGGDNIEIDDEGQLWIASHPKLLAVIAHQSDPSHPAPAQVVRIAADGETVEEVYLTDGQPLAAASAAARLGNRLLIGQIFGAGFLDCEMGEPPSQPGG
jgi:arylesterase/paraoxonase